VRACDERIVPREFVCPSKTELRALESTKSSYFPGAQRRLMESAANERERERESWSKKGAISVAVITIGKRFCSAECQGGEQRKGAEFYQPVSICFLSQPTYCKARSHTFL